MAAETVTLTFATTPTAEELKSLEKLRELLKEAGIEFDVERHDESTLIRFIRARDDVSKSFEMFKKTLEWRKKVGADEIYQKRFPNLIPLRNYWPGNFHKVDKEGIPVYIERIGLSDFKGVCKNVPDEDLINFHIWCMEENAFLKKRWAKLLKRPIHGNIVIEDLKGLSWAHTDGIGLLKKLAQIDDNNYPENLKKLFLINCPTLFTMIWKAVKPFLNENTIKKIRICGSSDYKSALLEDIPAENLPEEYGGTCKCEGGCCIGGGSYVHVPPTPDQQLQIHHRLPPEYLEG